MAASPERKFYVLTMRGQIGPVDRAGVKDLLRAGKVEAGDQIRTGSGRPLGTVAEVLAQARIKDTADLPAGAGTTSGGDPVPATRRGRGQARRNQLGVAVAALSVVAVIAVVGVAWAVMQVSAPAAPPPAPLPPSPTPPPVAQTTHTPPADPARTLAPSVLRPELPPPATDPPRPAVIADTHPAPPPAQAAAPAPVAAAPDQPLVDDTITAMAFTLWDGQATWGGAGACQGRDETPWVGTHLPPGAIPDSGSDGWQWVDDPLGSPGRFHLGRLTSGMHQHIFTAPGKMPFRAGDDFYAYVLLDATHPPAEVMVQWKRGDDWQHRAWWGEKNIIGWGGTQAGSLPAAGAWVRLEVSPRQIGFPPASPAGRAAERSPDR
jgi:hypothetical protein